MASKCTILFLSVAHTHFKLLDNKVFDLSIVLMRLIMMRFFKLWKTLETQAENSIFFAIRKESQSSMCSALASGLVVRRSIRPFGYSVRHMSFLKLCALSVWLIGVASQMATYSLYCALRFN